MGATCCGGCQIITGADPNEIQSVPPNKVKNRANQFKSGDDEEMDFDQWIDSIEKHRKNWFDIYTIKDLLAEASIKYGQKNADMT